MCLVLLREGCFYFDRATRLTSSIDFTTITGGSHASKVQICTRRSGRRRHERSRQKAEKPRGKTAGLLFDHRMKRISVLRRPGSDLLFQALRLSTIGAEDFDGRVRDGIG